MRPPYAQSGAASFQGPAWYPPEVAGEMSLVRSTRQIQGTVVLQKHSVGETEPTANLCGRLFSFQSEDFPDELNLHKGYPLSATTSLGLSGSCAEPRRLESSAKLHRTIEILGWQRKRKS